MTKHLKVFEISHLKKFSQFYYSLINMCFRTFRMILPYFCRQILAAKPLLAGWLTEVWCLEPGEVRTLSLQMWAPSTLTLKEMLWRRQAEGSPDNHNSAALFRGSLLPFPPVPLLALTWITDLLNLQNIALLCHLFWFSWNCWNSGHKIPTWASYSFLFNFLLLFN